MTPAVVLVNDLAMLLRRSVVRLRMIDDHKGNALADDIMDFLLRKGLADGTGILRSAISAVEAEEREGKDGKG